MHHTKAGYLVKPWLHIANNLKDKIEFFLFSPISTVPWIISQPSQLSPLTCFYGPISFQSHKVGESIKSIDVPLSFGSFPPY